MSIDPDNAQSCALSVPIVVILVHGTWARGANWTKEGTEDGDLVRERIRMKIALTVVFPEPYEWSGDNQWEARRRGAEGFLRYMESVANNYPESPIFIVVHSHAGNITKAALEQANVVPPKWLSRLRGLICLATPFFDLSERKIAILTYATSPNWIVSMGVILLWWVALYQTASLLGSHSPYSTDDWWALLIVKSSYAAVILAVWLGCRGLTTRVDMMCDFIKTSMEWMLSGPANLSKFPRSTRMLVIWTRGDEAYLVLRLLQMVLVLPYALISMVSALAFALYPIFLASLFLAGLCYILTWLLSMVIGSFFRGDFSLLMDFSGFVIDIVKFLVIAVIGTSILALTALGLLHVVSIIIRYIASGRELGFLSYGLIRLRIYRQVPGAENMLIRAKGWYWTALRHSIPWRDPEVLSIVGEWIDKYREASYGSQQTE